MKRFFVLLLIVVALTMGVAWLVRIDGGYVLVAFAGYSIETTVWAALLLLVLAFMAAYGLLRFMSWSRRWIARLGIGGENNRRSIASRRGVRHTRRALIFYLQGHFHKARRLLVKAAASKEQPLLNYLLAAEISDKLEDRERVDGYLKEAEETGGDAFIAVKLVAAKMLYRRGNAEEALRELRQTGADGQRQPAVVELLVKLESEVGEWQLVSSLLASVSGRSERTVQQLDAIIRPACLRVIERIVETSDSSAERLSDFWRELPAKLRADPELTGAFTAALMSLGAGGEAEQHLRKSLNKNWNDQLAYQYGKVSGDDPTKQLAIAEKWLPAHSESAPLLLSLGRLCLANKLWGKAREYFEASIRCDSSVEAQAELARLYKRLGEQEKSEALYQQALIASIGKLPQYPLP